MTKLTNPMRRIEISKITINIGVGEAGEKLEKAKSLLEKMTERKAVVTKSKRRSTFGVSRGRPIGVKIVLRGEDAEKFLKRALDAIDGIKASQFDGQGNLSFGIAEYIDIPGIKYDPSLGIMGMDVTVTLQRPGYRVARRRLESRIGKTHKITKQEAIDWAKQSLGISVTD